MFPSAFSLADFRVPAVRFAQMQHWSAGFSWGPRRLYDHELLLIFQGRGHLEIENRAFDAPPGRLFLLLPGVRNTFFAANDSTWTALGVHFDWKNQADSENFQNFSEARDNRFANEKLWREPRVFAGWDAMGLPFFDLPAPEGVAHWLEEIAAAFKKEDEESRAQCGALLVCAWAEIARQLRLGEELRRKDQIGPDARRKVAQAKAILERESWTVAQVAAHVGWSSDHLAAMFRAVLGVAPSQVQLRAKIRRAQALLHEGRLSIAEIALQTGFADSSHLARHFKRETGQTPRQYQTLVRRI